MEDMKWSLDEAKETFRKYYEKRWDEEVPKFFEKYLSGEVDIDGKRRSNSDTG